VIRRTPLRRSRLQELLPDHPFTRDVRILGRVSSTSDLLLDLASRGAATHGTLLTAEEQTRGRGRRGTRWECPSGMGLLFSFLLDPAPASRRLLPTALSLGVARAVEALDLPVLVKWPNDVLVGDLKIAGCLVELSGEQAVAGIGLNVNQAEEELPSDAPLRPASLALLLGRQVDREDLLARILREIARGLDALEEPSAQESLVAEALQKDALAGRRVTLVEGDRLMEGRVLQAHPLQGILFRPEAGEADVRLRPEHTRILSLR